jgi:hypothetical protein
MRDDNDGNKWQQRLQCGPGIALLTTTATGATPTITATVATARTTKIMTKSLEGGRRPQQQRLKHGSGDGGIRSDDSGGRQQ